MAKWFVDQPPPMGGEIPCTAFVESEARDADGWHWALITVYALPGFADPGELARQICEMLNDGRLDVGGYEPPDEWGGG